MSDNPHAVAYLARLIADFVDRPPGSDPEYQWEARVDDDIPLMSRPTDVVGYTRLYILNEAHYMYIEEELLVLIILEAFVLTSDVTRSPHLALASSGEGLIPIAAAVSSQAMHRDPGEN